MAIQKIEGKCPRCGNPVNEVPLINFTDKELRSLDCSKCGWDTVIEVDLTKENDAEEK